VIPNIKPSLGTSPTRISDWRDYAKSKIRRQQSREVRKPGQSRMLIPAGDRLLVDILRQTVAAFVRGELRDLAARELAVFLICYLTNAKQTVRGLATALRIGRPAITRALDRLEELGLAQRQPEKADRRSVLVSRTVQGNAFLRDLSKVMADAERATRSARSAQK
jgi:DNA-binding MarR family transcriptional regulator